MGLRAYLMVNVKDQCRYDQFQKAVMELEDMLEVDFVDPVVGATDIMVMIEAAVSVESVARTIEEKPWVESVSIFKIVSIFERHRSSKRELLKALKQETVLV